MFDLSIIKGNYLNEISEAERSKLFRFIDDRDFVKAGSTLSRYIGSKDSFIKEFMTRLAGSNNVMALIVFSNLLNFDFDKFYTLIENGTIEKAFDSICKLIDNNFQSDDNDILTLGGAISGILVINYDKFSEEFRLKIIKKLTQTKPRNYFFQIYGQFSTIFLKLPETLRYELLLSRVDESTSVFSELYDLLPEEVKEKGLTQIINVNNSLWYCYNYSEKFPEHIKKVFYNKVFDLITKDNSLNNKIERFGYFYSHWDRYYELDDSISFLINHFDKYKVDSQIEIIKYLTLKASNKFLIQNLGKISQIAPNERLINIIYYLIKDEIRFSSTELYNFQEVWKKLPEELILKFIPTILEADKGGSSYEQFHSHLSRLLNSLSNDAINKIITALIKQNIDIKYLLLSLSNNLTRISNELREELFERFSSNESDFYLLLRNFAENLNNYPEENWKFILQFFENKKIKINYEDIFNKHVTKYSHELILALLEDRNTKPAISYAIVHNFDKLSSKIIDEFIKRMVDKKELKPILSLLVLRIPRCYASGFPTRFSCCRSSASELILTGAPSGDLFNSSFNNYTNTKSKILLIEGLAKTENILHKRAIGKLLVNEFQEKYNNYGLPTDFFNKILNIIYKEKDNTIQICISQILTKKYYDISEELRNKIINFMLNLDKSFLYLTPIIEKDFSEVNEILSGEANLLLTKAMENIENNQIYLIPILSKFFRVISKDLREKAFFSLLDDKDYLISLARIFSDNFSTFEIDKKIIFDKLIREPKTLKTIIKIILENVKEVPEFLKEQIIEFSQDNQISNFLVWQTVINYNEINNEIIDKLFNNFKNTKNPEIAKIFILALFDKNCQIPYDEKEKLLINLISFKPSRQIFYRNLSIFYKNLSEETKVNLVNFLNIDSGLFPSIIKLIIQNKSPKGEIPLSLQVSILKELSKKIDSDKNIAKILKLNFKSFPENFRNELIQLLFKEKNARRNIIQIIVYQSENLPANIHNLILEAYENNINLNRIIINKVSTDNKKAVLVNLSKFYPSHYYKNLDEYIIKAFLFECINNPKNVMEELKIIGINDEDLFTSISNLFESKKIVNFLATTLRLHFYKFPGNIGIELLKGFINYKYDVRDDYLYFYVADAIRFNPNKIPKDVANQVIKKLNETEWTRGKALEIKRLIY